MRCLTLERVVQSWASERLVHLWEEGGGANQLRESRVVAHREERRYSQVPEDERVEGGEDLDEDL